ncbi:glycosyltransferase family 2 protein [Aeoliella mucimassa]|uniref:Putative glycosyltransferase EpsJ n=1 Tax=Aeoliella mucimassa TaxID=2527972 RepID=A0A518ALT9_9BACT|nr:glycosyltransferase family 2 protein [Aeoliella mucimassa]QDU55673.1 putative glycosyltransferase EpsJ [Aeoliella mucimassa]
MTVHTPSQPVSASPNEVVVHPTGITSVSVVIPVRNESLHIRNTLEQIVRQDLHGIHLEVFVVDGESTDNTRDIVLDFATHHPMVQLLDNPNRLSSGARNIAIEHMRGDVLVVIDGHCEIPTREYFLDLVAAFEESGADCLGRPQPLDVSNATPLQKAIAAARSSRLGHHPESFIYSDEPQFVPAKSVAVAYRREVFDRVGQFDENFDAHEDGEFNLRCDRAGLSCYLDPRLKVKYLPRTSLTGLFKQMVRYGRGRVRLARKHAGMWGLGSLIPACLVLYLIIGAVASLLLNHAWIPYVVGLSIYLAAVATSGLIIALQQHSLAMLYRVPVVLATVHIGAGWGVLVELLGGSRRMKTATPPSYHEHLQC